MRRSARLGSRSPRTVLLLALALVLVGTLAVLVVDGRGSVTRQGWNLVWDEEFDASVLDAGHWNAQDLASPRNSELQYYTPANVHLVDSYLELTTRREPLQGRDFTSAAVDTHGKFSFTYGRVEIRARLPAMGQGVWPALWMLGNGCDPVGGACPWPTAGANEIDIMEAVNTPSSLYNDLHFGTTEGQSQSPGRCEHHGVDLSAHFHTFAVEWEPGGVVRWYLDDDLICERSAPGFFDQPMYLFLNTAVGGVLPGPPAADTVFPQHFLIDSVRVYQRP